jgi:RimJ/RimL family protein N-acetyltransferase
MTEPSHSRDSVSAATAPAAVVLSPLRESDAPTLRAWINDRDTVLFNAAYRPVGDAAHAAWFARVQQDPSMVVFGVRTLVDDSLVGSCQLHGIHPVHRSAELQIRIGSEGARGRGFGTEAVHLLLCHGFRDLNLERIFLHVFATNTRAIRVYERLGFVREGRLRRAAFIDGSYIDVVVMAVLRDEWNG